jgi:membrane protease YdiL (CAAX protease family)
LPLLVLMLIFLWIFFAIIYLRTRNLIFAVGVHSLMNQSLPLFNTSAGILSGQLPVILLTIAILLLFPRKARNSFSVSNPV